MAASVPSNSMSMASIATPLHAIPPSSTAALSSPTPARRARAASITGRSSSATSMATGASSATSSASAKSRAPCAPPSPPPTGRRPRASCARSGSCAAPTRRPLPRRLSTASSPSPAERSPRRQGLRCGRRWLRPLHGRADARTRVEQKLAAAGAQLLPFAVARHGSLGRRA